MDEIKSMNIDPSLFVLYTTVENEDYYVLPYFNSRIIKSNADYSRRKKIE